MPDNLLVVNSEDELFEYLAAALESAAFRMDIAAVRFAVWPHVHIALPRTPLPSSVSSSMMESIVSYQESVYRLERLIQTSSIDLRSRGELEKKLYEFHVVVSGASSKLDIDLTEIFSRISAELVAKMESEHVLIAILGVAAAFATVVSLRSFLHARVERRKAELATDERVEFLKTQQFLAENDTKKLAILREAESRVPLVADAQELANDGQAALVRGVALNKGGAVLGVDLEEEVASEIIKTRRQQSSSIALDGTFHILGVDTTLEEGFRVRLLDPRSGDEFYATLQDRLASEEHYIAVQSAEWAKRPIRLRMRARKLRGKVIEAEISDAQLVD